MAEAKARPSFTAFLEYPFDAWRVLVGKIRNLEVLGRHWKILE